MNRPFKKCILAVVLLVLCVISANKVTSADVYSEGDLYYRIADDAAIITGYFGAEEELYLPASIAGYPVTELATGAFPNTCTVRVLHLPDTIMCIQPDSVGDAITVCYSDGTEPATGQELVESAYISTPEAFAENPGDFELPPNNNISTTEAEDISLATDTNQEEPEPDMPNPYSPVPESDITPIMESTESAESTESKENAIALDEPEQTPAMSNTSVPVKTDPTEIPAETHTAVSESDPTTEASRTENRNSQNTASAASVKRNTPFFCLLLILVVAVVLPMKRKYK